MKTSMRVVKFEFFCVLSFFVCSCSSSMKLSDTSFYSAGLGTLNFHQTEFVAELLNPPDPQNPVSISGEWHRSGSEIVLENWHSKEDSVPRTVSGILTESDHRWILKIQTNPPLIFKQGLPED